MRKLTIYHLLAFLMAGVTFTGCEVIGDIFKAGMWVGVVLVVLFIGLIFWLLGK